MAENVAIACAGARFLACRFPNTRKCAGRRKCARGGLTARATHLNAPRRFKGPRRGGFKSPRVSIRRAWRDPLLLIAPTPNRNEIRAIEQGSTFRVGRLARARPPTSAVSDDIDGRTDGRRVSLDGRDDPGRQQNYVSTLTWRWRRALAGRTTRNHRCRCLRSPRPWGDAPRHGTRCRRCPPGSR